MKTTLYLTILALIVGCKPATTSEHAKTLAASEIEENAVAVTWLTDIGEAQKLAKEKNLTILADFSGSDWCRWCIRLEKEVFSQNEFKKYAKENLVLLLVDFPKQNNQSEQQKEENGALAQKYNVKGFPTVLLLNSEGEVTGRTGYESGGAAKYVEHIKELLQK